MYSESNPGFPGEKQENKVVTKRDSVRSQEKIGGLSSKDDIQQDLRCIGTYRYGIGGEEESFIFDTPSAFALSEQKLESVANAFIEEFEADVESFKKRLSRLKIRITAQLKKSSPHISSEAVEWQRKNATEFQEQAAQAETDVPKLIGLYNARVLPNERLQPLKTLEPEDALLMQETLHVLPTVPDQARVLALSRILERINSLEGKIAAVDTQGELFASTANGFVREEDLKKAWVEFRNIVMELSAAEELGSWRSPAYKASRTPAWGPEQLHQRQDEYDYERVDSHYVSKVTKKIENILFGKVPEGVSRRSVLFSSGLHAFTAINHTVNDFTPDKPKVLSIPSYMEVDGYLRNHSPFRQNKTDLRFLVGGMQFDREGVAEQIKEEYPDVVVLPTVANTFDLTDTGLGSLLAALSSDEEWKEKFKKKFGGTDKRIFIIVDETVTSATSSWHAADLSKLPEFVVIISFQSLLKFAQEGLELGNLGIATIYGSASQDEKLMKLTKRLVNERQFVGVPSEGVVRRVDAVLSEKDLRDRLQRVGRNSQLIEDAINEVVTQKKSEIILGANSANGENAKKSGHTQDVGGIVMVGFNYDFVKNFVTVDPENKTKKIDPRVEKVIESVTSAFERLIVLFAKQQKLDVYMGTSFGFNATRLAIYKRYRNFEDDKEIFGYEAQIPFLRICPGTENIKDATEIAAIVCRVEAIFSEAIKNGTILELSKLINTNKYQITNVDVEKTNTDTEASARLEPIELRTREQLTAFYSLYAEHQTEHDSDYFKPNVQRWILRKVNEALKSIGNRTREKLVTKYYGVYKNGQLLATTKTVEAPKSKDNEPNLNISAQAIVSGEKGTPEVVGALKAIEDTFVEREKDCWITAEVASNNFVALREKLASGYRIYSLNKLNGDESEFFVGKYYGEFAKKEPKDTTTVALSVLDLSSIQRVLKDGFQGVRIELPYPDSSAEDWSVVFEKNKNEKVHIS